ncbi:MAG: 2-C-methyl-D-erythritol 2,4-cyclodiphosphate synthase [Balneolaceae bacterium]
MNFRVGLGYDVHPFEENRKLMLGGIEIPFDKGLKGHSDADVLLHSITDALLGAAGLGDIGTHFPDIDPKYKNADSAILLKESYELVKNTGYELSNLDATIVAEAPKIMPHVTTIRKRISSIMDCDIDRVSIKATTNEKMGFVGRSEGIAVHAIVLIFKPAVD